MSDQAPLQDLQQQLIQMTGTFCHQHADAEYAALCRKLIEKMGRKRSVPFASGRPEIWAAAIVHALGSINFLFDKSFPPCTTPDILCEHFQASKRTVTQKAKLIRDLFKLGYFDPEFSTQRMATRNPLAGLTTVNGLLVIPDNQFRDSD
jgi:hypothetical protein